ncbi:MAG: isochorismatase family protein [Caldilineaceae bacterium]
MHQFTFTFQHQAMAADANGWAQWEMRRETRVVPAARVAIIICDMWDNHWSRGASERVNIMAPRMNQVLHAARNRGAHILHAPSETMPFYVNSPARQRMLELPDTPLPIAKEHPAPSLPIDASDHGSDTGENSTFKAWSRQHPALEIDEGRDGISDNGEEIYRYLQQQQIEQVLIMGVHTNMCVLNRSFAIKQMVRWGVSIALVRDLTDAMYNPAMSPYVSHDEGVQLVIGYIEKFWCPTMESGQLA